jgi:hypothetical protein
MERKIETDLQYFKDYSSEKKYNIYRSCIYESSSTTLTIRIFVHELRTGDKEQEIKIGEISISVIRGRWNELAQLNNAVKANEQLKEAAGGARENNWENDPLHRMVKRGCEIIRSKIREYEVDGSPIEGNFYI